MSDEREEDLVHDLGDDVLGDPAAVRPGQVLVVDEVLRQAGSATVYALRQLGSSIGVAVLGTLAVSGYRSRLDVSGLPAGSATAGRAGVNSGVAVAHRLGNGEFLASARSAFVHGMDVTLWVCGGISVAGVALATALLPGRPRPVPAVPQQAAAAEPAPTSSPAPAR
jgi:hypothetical protein